MQLNKYAADRGRLPRGQRNPLQDVHMAVALELLALRCSPRLPLASACCAHVVLTAAVAPVAATGEAVRQGVQLHPPDAHALRARGRAQVGCDYRHCHQPGQPDGSAERAQGGEEDLGGEVQQLAQDGQEQGAISRPTLGADALLQSGSDEGPRSDTAALACGPSPLTALSLSLLDSSIHPCAPLSLPFAVVLPEA